MLKSEKLLPAKLLVPDAVEARRNVLRGLAAIACGSFLSSVAWGLSPSEEESLTTRIPIVDTHIHLFDPTRAGGVPWPLPTDKILYRPALPERYRQLAQPLSVAAAIAVECSPLAADNDWLLDQVRQNPLMVGAIGDLDPALPTFPAELDRLHRDPLFLGIRYGNLWDRDLGTHLGDTRFLDRIKLFAQTGLVFESANPNPKLIADLLRLSDLVPDLRILIDHLPHAVPPAEPAVRDSYLNHLRRLSERPTVYAKGSEILRQIDGKTSLRFDDYKDWLDTLWSLFGEDRILFGSDWPNSDTTSSLSSVFAIAHHSVAGKSTEARQKFFWRNSAHIYGWRGRTEAQRRLLLLPEDARRRKRLEHPAIR